MPTATALVTSPLAVVSPPPPTSTPTGSLSPLVITLFFLSALAASLPFVRSALADGERGFPYRTVVPYKTEFNPEKHMLPAGNDYKSSTIEELKRPITDDGGRCVEIIETAVSYYTKPQPELLKGKGRSQ